MEVSSSMITERTGLGRTCLHCATGLHTQVRGGSWHCLERVEASPRSCGKTPPLRRLPAQARRSEGATGTGCKTRRVRQAASSAGGPADCSHGLVYVTALTESLKQKIGSWETCFPCVAKSWAQDLFPMLLNCSKL